MGSTASGERGPRSLRRPAVPFITVGRLDPDLAPGAFRDLDGDLAPVTSPPRSSRCRQARARVRASLPPRRPASGVRRRVRKRAGAAAAGLRPDHSGEYASFSEKVLVAPPRKVWQVTRGPHGEAIG